MKTFEYVLKHNPLVNKVFVTIASACLRIISFFIPIDKRAVFLTAHNKKYNDSAKAIYERLIADKRFQKYKFYWAVNNDQKSIMPGNFIIVKPDSIKYFLISMKCKYWIASVNVERSLHYKKKKCVFLNTWHGIPIKTVGNMAAGRKDFNFSNVNYFVVSGEYEIDIYKKSFNLQDNQMIRTGLPRNEILYHYNTDSIRLIRSKLNIEEGKKVILYAPTWRDSKDGGKSYCIKPPIDFSYWEKVLGDRYVVLLRAHPYTNEILGVRFNKFVRDCSSYQDINDLLIVSDILVSDYSATIFDYCILEKPFFCFGYDYKDYSSERGFVLDINEAFHDVLFFDEKNLVNKIASMNYEHECLYAKEIKKKYIEYGGNAVELCIDYLFKGADL